MRPFVTLVLMVATGALEWAISVLEGLPTTSTTDDPPAWEPGGGVAVPSRGGQTLGISGR